jgi:hypothetical protein
MQAYTTKLIDLIESKAEGMAGQWAADVMKHERTPSYHSLPKDMVIEQGINFYKLFRRMALAENPYKEAKTFSWKYAENFYFRDGSGKTAGGGKSESNNSHVRLCILSGHRKISGINHW